MHRKNAFLLERFVEVGGLAKALRVEVSPTTYSLFACLSSSSGLPPNAYCNVCFL